MPAAGPGPPDHFERLDILWGGKAIARFLGCGLDFVYGLGKDPASPVRKRRGMVYAFRDELEAYFRDGARNP